LQDIPLWPRFERSAASFILRSVQWPVPGLANGWRMRPEVAGRSPFDPSGTQPPARCLERRPITLISPQSCASGEPKRSKLKIITIYYNLLSDCQPNSCLAQKKLTSSKLLPRLPRHMVVIPTDEGRCYGLDRSGW